jgi:hypothetical protein
MNEPKFIAPKPEVIHLTTLFRRIENGEIRIPRFQRNFVWARKNIIDLLESVYRGYPVGSLLFWRPLSATTISDTPDAFGKHIEAQSENLTYVLDGQQRLTTLYRCFFGEKEFNSPFSVLFLLESKTFIHSSDFRGSTTETVPLSALFSTREFLQQQQLLLSGPNGDAFADSAIRLHSRFQEYMIPAVTIEGRDVSEVVEIFERVNRTGTTLGAVDFMRAVTWSAEFDLQGEVEHLAASFADTGFVIPQETLVKLVAISAGKEPTAEDMVSLRRAELGQLRDAVAMAEQSARRAIRFFKDNVGIGSYEFVPYEAQFLVVCRAFQSTVELNNTAVALLVRWYWLSSFNESLRGSPDHVVARLVQGVSGLAYGAGELPIGQLLPTKETFKSRKFLRGGALSSAVAALFARRNARSVLTGRVISPESYMQEFESSQYRSLFITHPQSKIMANVFLCLEEDWRTVRISKQPALTLEALKGLDPAMFDATLKSQMITYACYESLIAEDYEKFVELRASTMLEAAQDIIGNH